MNRKSLIPVLLTALAAFGARADSFAAPVAAGMLRPAERIVVKKSDRRMELWRDGAVIASYRISLGLVPEGHKQREGDFRTPEGSYRLTRRNARSDFFLAVQVSYPEPTDLALPLPRGLVRC